MYLNELFFVLYFIELLVENAKLIYWVWKHWSRCLIDTFAETLMSFEFGSIMAHDFNRKEFQVQKKTHDYTQVYVQFFSFYLVSHQKTDNMSNAL